MTQHRPIAADPEQTAIQEGLKATLGELQFQLIILSSQLRQRDARLAELEAKLNTEKSGP